MRVIKTVLLIIFIVLTVFFAHWYVTGSQCTEACSILDVDNFLRVEGHLHVMCEGTMFRLKVIDEKVIWLDESTSTFYTLQPMGDKT